MHFPWQDFLSTSHTRGATVVCTTFVFHSRWAQNPHGGYPFASLWKLTSAEEHNGQQGTYTSRPHKLQVPGWENWRMAHSGQNTDNCRSTLARISTEGIQLYAAWLCEKLCLVERGFIFTSCKAKLQLDIKSLVCFLQEPLLHVCTVPPLVLSNLAKRNISSLYLMLMHPLSPL